MLQVLTREEARNSLIKTFRSLKPLDIFTDQAGSHHGNCMHVYVVVRRLTEDSVEAIFFNESNLGSLILGKAVEPITVTLSEMNCVNIIHNMRDVDEKSSHAHSLNVYTKWCQDASERAKKKQDIDMQDFCTSCMSILTQGSLITRAASEKLSDYAYEDMREPSLSIEL